MLKNNETKLELILDIDIHLFIEIGKKSGVSYIAKIYSKTKNKCMKSHDPNKPSKSITHLDIDNLYGQAISKYFPYGRFKWLSKKKTMIILMFTQLVKIVLMVGIRSCP